MLTNISTKEKAYIACELVLAIIVLIVGLTFELIKLAVIELWDLRMKMWR